MTTRYNLRAIAATIIHQVLEQGLSLTPLLAKIDHTEVDHNQLQHLPSLIDRPLLQEICFGILRVLPQLDWCLQQLIAKPLSGKQKIIHSLLRVGLYQLLHTRIPPHAAVTETVNATNTLKQPQLKGMVNAVLRQFQRQQHALLDRFQSRSERFLHPEWLLEMLQQAYPEQWQEIIHANNQKPPMWLRVNSLHHSREQYQALLQEANLPSFLPAEHAFFSDALCLEKPCQVSRLPGFSQGWATVQDLAAQGCIPLLQPQNDELILDLCAAPGGKTTHILQAAPTAQVLAVDIDEQRLQQIKENLQRLQGHAQLLVGDGRTPHLWAEGRKFQRILLDAPCSASGVIRRHPDIKWLRRQSDIATLVALQTEMLDAIWPYLLPGGVLLYATCSILPQENSQQISGFLQRHADATLENINSPSQPIGWQRLPQINGGDGFFYAKLIKNH